MSKLKKKPIIIILLFLFIFIFSFLVYQLLTNNLSGLDNSIYNLIIKFKSNGLTNFFKIITKLGDAVCLITLCIIFYIFIKSNKIKISIIINLVCSFIVNNFFKFIFARERPLGINLITETGYSFPSSHAMISTAFYGYLIYLLHVYIKNKKVKIPIIILLILLILIISISRIYLGVHFASDVIAGISLAMIYLISYIVIIKKNS